MATALIKDIRYYVKNNGKCELLGKYSKGYDGKFKFKCKCGNIFESTFNSFKRKKIKQCNECSKKLKYTIDNIREYVKNNSECELISENYINSHTKLKFKCKCGNIFETKFNSFKCSNKKQCNNCGRSKVDQKQKLKTKRTVTRMKINIEYIIKFVENNSKCKLVSEKYINATTKMKFICECGNVFETSWSNFRGTNKRKCNKCSIKIRALKISGKNNIKYDSTKTDDERKNGRHYPEYNNWVRKVFARDNYKCRCCGEKKTNIKAHHLDGYNWCKEKRTNIDNGITLCQKCHKSFHSVYGNGNNTKEQFEEWIGKTITILEHNKELNETKKIKDLTTGAIYNSAKECGNILGVKSLAQVYYVCNNKRKNKVDGSYRRTIKGHKLIWFS